MTREQILKELDVLKKRAEELKKEADYYSAREQALKLCLNGSYGAFTAKFFILYHKAVGETITAQGRELTQTMEKNNREYWYKMWHKDIEVHKRMCINNVEPINEERFPTSIYCDTDSISADSMVNVIMDGQHYKLTIEQWFNINLDDNYNIELSGHETVITDDQILNYKDGSLYHAGVSRIIRHKVSKQKWKLKTKSGKEIIVTNDHSMIVFRDGKEIEVKPSDILKTDKILTII